MITSSGCGSHGMCCIHTWWNVAVREKQYFSIFCTMVSYHTPNPSCSITLVMTMLHG